MNIIVFVFLEALLLGRKETHQQKSTEDPGAITGQSLANGKQMFCVYSSLVAWDACGFPFSMQNERRLHPDAFPEGIALHVMEG